MQLFWGQWKSDRVMRDHYGEQCPLMARHHNESNNFITVVFIKSCDRVNKVINTSIHDSTNLGCLYPFVCADRFSQFSRILSLNSYVSIKKCCWLFFLWSLYLWKSLARFAHEDKPCDHQEGGVWYWHTWPSVAEIAAALTWARAEKSV